LRQLVVATKAGTSLSTQPTRRSREDTGEPGEEKPFLQFLPIPCSAPFNAAMFQYVALAEEKSWQPGPYPGVELKVLHRNEATGGVVVLRKFNAGTVVPAHTHPLANEIAYVLSGEWEEDDQVHAPGTLFFAPRGEKHGPHHARTEVISLTHFDGPLTVA
jgi:quercetin dioxygenase-like cupin family protein